MKSLLISLLLLSLANAQSLPNAPSKTEKRIFWISNAVVLPASIVYDAEVTHQGIAHHKCWEANSNLPRHPSRGQLYLYNGAFAAAEFGLDLLLHKAHIHYLDNAGAVFGSIVHFQAGSTWFTKGCY